MGVGFLFAPKTSIASNISGIIGHKRYMPGLIRLNNILLALKECTEMQQKICRSHNSRIFNFIQSNPISWKKLYN